MDYLKEDWFLENNIDAEYQRYRLLSYLKSIHEHFKKSKVYPYLDELKHHHRVLTEFVDEKRNIEESFPTKVNYKFGEGYIEINSHTEHVDIDKLKEIDDTVNYSIAEIEREISFGEQILDYIDETTTIELMNPIIKPIKMGYWLIRDKENYVVWYYKVSDILVAENLLHVDAIKLKEFSLGEDTDFIRKRTSENSDWWLVNSREHPPIESTLVPILKYRIQSISLDT